MGGDAPTEDGLIKKGETGMKERLSMWLVPAMHTYLPRLFKGSHFLYFGAAAAGAHGLYSVFAGSIVFMIVLAFVFHVELD